MARDLYEAGRCELDEVNAAEAEWEEASIAFRKEAAKVGEFARVMLECLAACDPQAFLDVVERAGLKAASERLAKLELCAEEMRVDLIEQHNELRTLKERIQAGFVALKTLDDRTDELRNYPFKKVDRKPAWQAI